MTDPNTLALAVRGSLLVQGTTGRRVVCYWYHSPFFWRVEQDGILVLQTGRDEHVRIPGQMLFDPRLLGHRKILAHQFGLYGLAASVSEDHVPTGRPCHRLSLPDSADTSMLVDDETQFTLQFRATVDGQPAAGDHDLFEVTETLDPSLFGETSFETQGYYHGSLG